ncbi:MAG: alpha-galactosidase [Lachnospiraceae bacterium]|nr:alpha-galactosidase [Lachnospiraceae bacterium]
MIKLTYTSDGILYTAEETDENVILEEVFEGERHRVKATAKRDLELKDAAIEFTRYFEDDDRIMANGYQSWTETKEFEKGEYLNDLKAGPRPVTSYFKFRYYGSQAFWDLPKGRLQGFDFSWINGRDPLFIGSFNHKNAYLLIWFFRKDNRILLQSDIDGRVLKAGESFTVFDYMLSDRGDAYFASYTPVTERKLFGYTSWYNHYQNINEQLIFNAIEQADSRFDLFQIDDGFETYVGDWLSVDRKKFPTGLKPVVDRIHEKGMMAGIWLAPFVAEEKSQLMYDHPDWFPIHPKKGRRIYAGSNWSNDCPLDLNIPEAVEYIRKSLRHYVELGFDFFKLDFLYAVNLKPLYGKTRCETSEFAYSLLREELAGKLILGCGATLSNAFERFEYMRVGPDVSLSFDDAPYMSIFHPERVSTKNTILNSVFRSCLDGHMFLNDPDVFLLRDENIKLNPEQRKSLTTMNALFGSLLMTSDDIGSYDEGKREILENALDLFRSRKNVSYSRNGRKLRVEYEQAGVKKSFEYDIKKGTMR